MELEKPNWGPRGKHLWREYFYEHTFHTSSSTDDILYGPTSINYFCRCTFLWVPDHTSFSLSFYRRDYKDIHTLVPKRGLVNGKSWVLSVWGNPFLPLNGITFSGSCLGSHRCISPETGAGWKQRRLGTDVSGETRVRVGSGHDLYEPPYHMDGK